MAEYVEREAVCKVFDMRCELTNLDHHKNLLLKAKEAVLNLPTVELEPVKHGRWMLQKSGNGTCSACGRTTVAVWDWDSSLNYCPHCGAKMDLGE